MQTFTTCNFLPTLIGDQLVLYYGYAHRSIKWWKRVFFHLIDLALVNSHILYNACTGNKLTQLDFCIAVARDLLDGYTRSTRRHHGSDPQLPLRLTERSFPEPVPNNGRPDCKVCSDRKAGQRHQTSFRCKLCKTPLCLYPCFEKYHTLLHYKVKYN